MTMGKEPKTKVRVCAVLKKGAAYPHQASHPCRIVASKAPPAQ